MTPVLPWDGLTEWFGEAMLLRRIIEILGTVADQGMEISQAELAELKLAANYAAGNRPGTPWERLARPCGIVTVPTDVKDQSNGEQP